MPLIDLDKLQADPRNANILDKEGMSKLTQNIQKSGFCPSLVVRPHPKKPDRYIIVDGHHRKLVVEKLGWQQVDCQIVQMSKSEAGLLLLTLNRLRGTDIPRKRAELMESLLPTLGLESLASLLPETPGEIEGLLALLKQEDEALERALQAQIEAERQSLPVPFGFMVPSEDAPLVQQVLGLYQANKVLDQGLALVAICRDVLAHQEIKDHG